MVKSFTILESAKTVVFKSSTIALAAAVCDALEMAGVPARLTEEHGSPAVATPREFAVQSSLLLSAFAPGGTIFTFVV